MEVDTNEETKVEASQSQDSTEGNEAAELPIKLAAWKREIAQVTKRHRQR